MDKVEELKVKQGLLILFRHSWCISFALRSWFNPFATPLKEKAFLGRDRGWVLNLGGKQYMVQFHITYKFAKTCCLLQSTEPNENSRTRMALVKACNNLRSLKGI